MVWTKVLDIYSRQGESQIEVWNSPYSIPDTLRSDILGVLKHFYNVLKLWIITRIKARIDKPHILVAYSIWEDLCINMCIHTSTYLHTHIQPHMTNRSFLTWRYLTTSLAEFHCTDLWFPTACQKADLQENHTPETK